ncbi:MAG: hypothetical protein LBG05_00620 [Treponema sp.]|nr:hypothetical protein [Treponema sp.]
MTQYMHSKLFFSYALRESVPAEAMPCAARGFARAENAIAIFGPPPPVIIA